MAKVKVRAIKRNFFNGKIYEEGDTATVDKGYFDRVGHRWAVIVEEEKEDNKEVTPKKKKKYENKESVSKEE